MRGGPINRTLRHSEPDNPCPRPARASASFPLRLDGFGDSSEWIDWLLSALSAIRVVLDQIEHDTLLAAQRAVRRSEILCFLGFACASENLTGTTLDRVGFPPSCASRRRAPPKIVEWLHQSASRNKRRDQTTLQ